MRLKNWLRGVGEKLTRIFRRKRASKKTAQNPPFLVRPRKTRNLPPAEIEAPGALPAVVVEERAPAQEGVTPLAAMAEFSDVQLSPHTRKAYKKDLQDFFSFLRVKGVWEGWEKAVTPALIAQYRNYLLQDRELAKGSVTRKLAVLKSFYRWSNARGWVSENPAELVRGFPQTQESKTGFLADSDIDRLLGSFPVLESRGLGAALGKIVVESLLMLGLRRSEASKMRVGHLEYLDGRWMIRIQGKGDRDRALPIPPRLLLTWSKWFQRLSDEAPRDQSLEEAPDSWLLWSQLHADQPILISSRAKSFDQPLSSSEIARIVRKEARRAGLVSRVSPHMLRATAITHALDQGASHRGVQQMAGWTSPLMITRYDKRRKDPRYSAVHHLKYAQLASPVEKSSPKPHLTATDPS